MSCTILLVEDDSEFSAVLKARLEANGFQVISAQNGDEGIQKFVSSSPDLVVTDLSMPIVDGFTMIRELRRFPKGYGIPIIVTTAREHVQDLCAMEGVRDYLTKPFEVDDLVMRIRWNLRDKLPGAVEPKSKNEPLSQSAAAVLPQVSAAIPNPSVPLPGNGKKILIIDDDESLREVIKMRLEAFGFKTLIATDGEKGIETARKDSPDLIVLDVVMPNLDGFSTLKQINQIREKKIPVVVMTGTKTISEDDFRMEGACAFLRKPVDGAKLAQQIKEILS